MSERPSQPNQNRTAENKQNKTGLGLQRGGKAAAAWKPNMIVSDSITYLLPHQIEPQPCWLAQKIDLFVNVAPNRSQWDLVIHSNKRRNTAEKIFIYETCFYGCIAVGSSEKNNNCCAKRMDGEGHRFFPQLFAFNACIASSHHSRLTMLPLVRSPRCAFAVSLSAVCAPVTLDSSGAEPLDS